MDHLKNAPLLEVIAEIHWRPDAPSFPAPMVPGTDSTHVFVGGAAEQFFTVLMKNCADAGFGRSERLIPSGFPTLPHQAVLRFRSNSRPEVLQAGMGMFAINGPKPYETWDVFRKVIESGLRLLESSRVDATPGPISEIIVKYINLYDGSLLSEPTAMEFLTKISGFNLSLPPVVGSLAHLGGVVDTNLTLSLPLTWGASLQLRIGDGKVADGSGEVKSGVITDTTVSIKENLPTDVDGMLQCFDRAHADIRKFFSETTKPIFSSMAG